MARLSPREITSEEIGKYNRDGAVLLRGYLPEHLLTAITDGLENAYRTPGTMATRLVAPDQLGEIRMDQMPSVGSQSFETLISSASIINAAATLLNVDRVHHVLDQMFYKPAGTLLPTAWHQDTPYLSVTGNDLCRLWISCDPSPAEATVSVIRGSHRWNVEYRPVEADDVEAKEEGIGADFSYDQALFDTSLPKVPKIAAYPESFDILSWDVEPGDVLAFNGNILHGNNHTLFDYPIPRRAFAVLWGAPTVRTLIRPGNRVPDVALSRGIGFESGVPLSETPQAYPVYHRST